MNQNGENWRRQLREELDTLSEAMPHPHHPRELGGLLLRLAPGEAGYLAACEVARLTDSLKTLEGYCSALKETNDQLLKRLEALEQLSRQGFVE